MIKTTTREVHEVGEYVYVDKQQALKKACQLLECKHCGLYTMLADEGARRIVAELIDFMDGSTAEARLRALEDQSKRMDEAYFRVKMQRLALERKNDLLRAWYEGYPNDCS